MNTKPTADHDTGPEGPGKRQPRPSLAERQAAALRANLHRRKEQARARDADAAADGPGDNDQRDAGRDGSEDNR